jgi:heat shock protein HtpX
MAATMKSPERDRGLELRMVATMLLLGLVYTVLGAALLAAGTGAMAMAIVLAAVAIVQLYFAEKLALRAAHARVVGPGEVPQLHALVERLCVVADLPKPRLAIAELDMVNAFVVGRSRSSATLCVTRGLLEALAGPQLEAVLAHELAHIKHRDVAVMTLASFFAGIAATITQLGIFVGGWGDRDREHLPFQVVVAISFAVYLISYFLILALSRYREFAADRGGALITGQPAALAAALMRISAAGKGIPQTDLRATEALNAFFIIPQRSALQALLSTHPPASQRIARLLDLDARMHQRVAARPSDRSARSVRGPQPSVPW